MVSWSCLHALKPLFSDAAFNANANASTLLVQAEAEAARTAAARSAAEEKHARAAQAAALQVCTNALLPFDGRILSTCVRTVSALRWDQGHGG